MGLNMDKALLAAEAVDPAEVVDLLRALVRIPSHYPGPGEVGVVAFLEAYLVERGFKPLRQEAAPGRPNLVADLGEGEGGLILEGHTDVVTPGNEGLWRYPPYGPWWKGAGSTAGEPAPTFRTPLTPGGNIAPPPAGAPGSRDGGPG